MGRAILLAPLRACLACNGTALPFIIFVPTYLIVILWFYFGCVKHCLRTDAVHVKSVQYTQKDGGGANNLFNFRFDDYY